MTNVYDSANQVEKDLRETDAYIALKEAYKVVNEDSEAGELFKKFQNIQMSFQEKQMTGQDISDEEIQAAQELTTVVSANEKINALMNCEQQMSVIVNDLNKIIMKPIQELYQGVAE